MKNYKGTLFLILIIMMLGFSCNNDENPLADCENEEFFCEFGSRNFEMGFSTWPYAPTVASIENTYDFIGENADIYSEHIDSNIPWNAWINDLSLPSEFTNDIASRASKKLPNAKLTVSVSLLNSSRSDLAFDYDGSIPDYAALNDKEIEDAYFKHLQYIAEQLNPDYLLLAIEVNELLKNAPEKWDAYKLLMANIRARIQEEFPALQISESITLHNFYQPDVTDSDSFIEEIANYANTMELVSISFYPFFKGLKTEQEFKRAFDFVHEKIERPIAIAETNHLAEDLSVEAVNLFIAGNESEQNDYLKALLTQAQIHDYEYVIWWAHRDFDELWETFPEEVKDLGRIWRDTGLLDEEGRERPSYETWKLVLNH
ncbi:Glycosyl hydrolase family 53 [Marivirga sericea]|uniref:Glycosyl hydrolase family 53 n=1 Tax=Marivirga sericea TaxID=1028 RepID=A0A1X7KLL3_9BACT|nr:glycosyl hydrolase 53 family protein [Marivirga sericea]SMG42031.1 Glycosyl hydrolase family 53 [Marivirga sericea]